MGYKLYREVKVWAPASLTRGEKLAALVIADDANDDTRVTWSSVGDPEIMRQAMVPDDRAMRRIITKLKREKVLEHLSGGHNGRVAKYRFLHLVPAEGGEKQGENHPGTEEVAGWKPPSYCDESNGSRAEDHPATDHVAGQISPSSRVETTLPTPNPSTTSSSPAEVVDQPPTGGAGRKEEAPQEQNDTTTAAAFLEALPEPWGVGRVTAAALAPLLAERAAERRWALDAALTEELTKNPGGINDHRRVLRSRIEDLKYRLRPPAQRTAEQSDRTCVDCGRPHPNLTDTGICPPCLSGKNSDARRPMPADFRQAIRRARATAPEGDPR